MTCIYTHVNARRNAVSTRITLVPFNILGPNLMAR